VLQAHRSHPQTREIALVTVRQRQLLEEAEEQVLGVGEEIDDVILDDSEWTDGPKSRSARTTLG
jgi:hypothetical protein